MNKCKKCGAEFEGKFCPECGTPWLSEEEKICPKCRAVLKASAKFCNECGYSFETQSAPAPAPKPAPTPAPKPAPTPPKKIRRQLTAGVRKLYAAVSVLPAALLGALSVLMFLFFLAPVAVTPGGNLMGVQVPSVSYGNVYAGSNYAGMSFAGSIKALIVFAAFALFVSFLILISCVFSNLRDKRYTIAGKKVFLRNIFTAVGYILFFALFVISCILMGQIASAGGGLGMMKAGAAPILVLVFTLVCSLAALACALAGTHLRKSYPALIEEQEEKIAAAKPTRVETWIKKHKIWTAGISAVLVVAIIVAVAVPMGLANRHNGTYYAYNGETEEYDTTRYYKLSGGTWKNEAGEKGKISFDGEKVTITYDSSNGMDKTGSSVITSEGTISGGVLKVDGEVFAKGKHKHKYKWETTIEPTCVTSGEKDGTCACGHSDREALSALGHRYSNHICVRCGRNSNLELEYTLNEEETEYSVTGIGSCTDLEIIIPAEFNNKPVTSIGYKAFDGCSGLKSIEISDSVTSIGYEAFDGCSGLKSVTIGDGVTSIGSEAFYGCSGLTGELKIPGSVVSIGKEAFSYCSGLTSVTIGSGVTSIGSEAFWNCRGLKSIVIPDSVTSIGNSAFDYCTGLTSITLPVSVTSIGYSVFSGCSGLEHIKVAAGNPTYRSEQDCLIETNSNTLILGCKSSKIPDSVTKIGEYAFEGCSGLKSIAIPASVTSIGEYAFEYCSGLTSIMIPDSVTSIESEAFHGCSGLKSVTIGDGVTSIGDYAFAGCSRLKSVMIGSGVTSIGCGMFSGSGLTSIVIPDSVISIREKAFDMCDRLKSITIPKSVVSIGESAFDMCYRLTNIQFKGTVRKWQAIQKGSYWDHGSEEYTVTCTNGKVDKSGNVTYFEG